jgi:hypothetical protein
MKRSQSILLMVCLSFAAAGAIEKTVTGKVTYVAGGMIYTSLGREAGVRDSSTLVVLSQKDTIGTLKVVAVSSRSSVCRILHKVGPISVGNDVLAVVSIESESRVRTDTITVRTQVPGELGRLGGARPVTSTQESGRGSITTRGRVGMQYYATQYQTSAYNMSQPGIVLNLYAAARDVPLKFELYSNLRSLSYGTGSPFSGHAINQSRIYRLSLQYDDGLNAFSAGRILPAFSPSIGYVDGVSFSRTIGSLLIGSALGYQPSYELRGMETTWKKFAVFGAYRPGDSPALLVSSAYARTYFHSQLDREVVGTQVNFSSTPELFVYASSEVDLRKKSGDDLVSSASLTSLFANATYRLTDYLTIGAGVDASRPFYPFSTVRFLPDSFLDDRLRSGLNANFNLTLVNSITVYDSYSPRTSEGAFGQDYSNYSSVAFANVLGSGIVVRSNVNVNANEYTHSTGYGVQVQKNFYQVADFTLRYQQYRYTIKQLSRTEGSHTIGADLMVFLTNNLVLLASYDSLRGYGADSQSLFSELSVRF